MQTNRVEVVPEEPPGGRRLLDLGDERREPAVAAARGVEGRGKVPGRRRALRGLGHPVERRPGLALGDLDLLVPDDLLEDVPRDGPVGADALGRVGGAAAAADPDALRGGDGVDRLAALPLHHLRRVEHVGVVQRQQKRRRRRRALDVPRIFGGLAWHLLGGSGAAAAYGARGGSVGGAEESGPPRRRRRRRERRRQDGGGSRGGGEDGGLHHSVGAGDGTSSRNVATGGCARSGHCCTMDRRGRIYRKI